MPEAVMVEPDYTNEGVEGYRTFNMRPQDAGAEYPIDIHGHRVQLRYEFHRKNGEWVLENVDYYCKRCGVECGIDGGANEVPDAEMLPARKYMLGHFLDTDCNP